MGCLSQGITIETDSFSDHLNEALSELLFGIVRLGQDQFKLSGERLGLAILWDRRIHSDGELLHAMSLVRQMRSAAREVEEQLLVLAVQLLVDGPEALDLLVIILNVLVDDDTLD